MSSTESSTLHFLHHASSPGTPLLLSASCYRWGLSSWFSFHTPEGNCTEGINKVEQVQSWNPFTLHEENIKYNSFKQGLLGLTKGGIELEGLRGHLRWGSSSWPLASFIFLGGGGPIECRFHRPWETHLCSKVISLSTQVGFTHFFRQITQTSASLSYSRCLFAVWDLHSCWTNLFQW